jgi:hypothetical protein
MSVETINNRATLNVLDALSLLKFIDMVMVTEFSKGGRETAGIFQVSDCDTIATIPMTKLCGQA